MAPFPVERLKPYPAWNTTALDFLDHSKLKDLVGICSTKWTMAKWLFRSTYQISEESH